MKYVSSSARTKADVVQYQLGSIRQTSVQQRHARYWRRCIFFLLLSCGAARDPAYAQVRGTPRHLVALDLLAFFQTVIAHVLPTFASSHASNAVYVYASVVILISRPRP
jgi:hypothetical protein